MEIIFCGSCQKVIDPTKGYFTAILAGIRSDYHVPCKPRYTFERLIREEPIKDIDQRAREAGL